MNMRDLCSPGRCSGVFFAPPGVERLRESRKLKEFRVNVWMTRSGLQNRVWAVTPLSLVQAHSREFAVPPGIHPKVGSNL